MSKIHAIQWSDFENDPRRDGGHSEVDNISGIDAAMLYPGDDCCCSASYSC